MQKQIKETIQMVKECAAEVYDELGAGWNEGIYQEAMEVALREEGITFETQRSLPISFRDHVIGQSIPDLIVWVVGARKRKAVVIDLKWDRSVKEDHRGQVRKYIKELRKQVKGNQDVHETGYVINFVKSSNPQVDEEEVEDASGVQVLQVKAE